MTVCSHCGGTGQEPDDKAIGEEVRRTRLKTGMSLREMAGRLEITPSYLCDLELGRRRWNVEKRQRVEAILAARLVSA